MNDINYNRTVMNLHNDGWKNSFTSVDVSMLGYGYVVSLYNQFYDQDIINESSIITSIFGVFWGLSCRKIHKIKMGVRLGR